MNCNKKFNYDIIALSKKEDFTMKKLSAIAIAAAFIMTSACTFAATATTPLGQKYLNKRQELLDKQNAAIKKQDAKMAEINKKSEEAKKQLMLNLTK